MLLPGAAGLVLGMLASQRWSGFWPAIIAFVIGNVLSWGWYAVIRILGAPGDAQDGIAIMFIAIAGGAGSYVGSYCLRLWRWGVNGSGRDQS